MKINSFYNYYHLVFITFGLLLMINVSTVISISKSKENTELSNLLNKDNEDDNNKKEKHKSIIPIGENVRQLIVDKLNDFRNKVANGVFEFKMSADQKSQLMTMPKMFFYKLDGAEASPDVGKLPPGKNLKRVYWNQGLESKAAFWGQKCSEEVSTDISKDPKKSFGQLSKMMYYKGEEPKVPDWTAVLQEWFQSISNSNFDIKNLDNYQYSGKGSSAFAQLIYSELTDIGCSSQKCGTSNTHPNVEEKNAKGVLFVCYLSPQGPLLHKKIYDRALSEKEVGKITCNSNGKKDPYIYLCPKNTNKKKRNKKLKKE